MSYLGIVFTFVFGGNVLFQYGAGACGSSDVQDGGKGNIGFLTLGVVSLLAAAIHTSFTRRVLGPLRLDSLEPVSYVLLVSSLLYGIATVLDSSPNRTLAEFGRVAKKQVLSCVVYASALTIARGSFTFLEAVAAGLVAAWGWWCAVVLLDKIMERLDLEDMPASLAGVPLRFLSAGLMAMAFSGVDALLVSRLVG